MVNKHRKWCSISSAIRELEIKTTMWYHYRLTRMSKIEITITPNASEDREKLVYSYIAG